MTMGVVTNQELLWDGLYQMGMHFFLTFFILIVCCFMNDLKLTRITFWVRNSLVENEHVVRFLKSSILSGVNSVLYCEIFLKQGLEKMQCVALLLDYHIVTSAALTGRAGGNGFNVSKKKSE